MPSYSLSPNAAQSIAQINQYTSINFSERQAIRYLKNLRGRFNFLVEDPELGTKRDEIKPGYDSYFEGLHTIYYKITDSDIAIIDTLHQSMEPGRHLLD